MYVLLLFMCRIEYTMGLLDLKSLEKTGSRVI